jgi:hypothetical protein
VGLTAYHGIPLKWGVFGSSAQGTREPDDDLDGFLAGAARMDPPSAAVAALLLIAHDHPEIRHRSVAHFKQRCR